MAVICDRLLSTGSCDVVTCRANHNVSTCDLCRLVFPSTQAYTDHLSQKEHKDALQKQGSNWFFCYLCSIHISGHRSFTTHIQSSGHLRRAKRAGVAPKIPAQQSEVIPGQRLCTSCNKQIPEQAWNRHVATVKHKSKEQFASFSVVLEEAEKDKHGVIVKDDLDFKIVGRSSAQKGVKISVPIKTTVRNANIKLVKTRLASSRGNTVPTPFTVTVNNTALSLARTIILTVTAKQNHVGRAEDRLDLIFEDLTLRTQFIISRPIYLIVGSKADHKALKPKSAYIPTERTTRHPELQIVEGVRPPALTVIPYSITLPFADIPKPLLDTISSGTVPEITKKVKELYLPQSIDGASYGRFYQILLWVEEHKQSHDLHGYDIKDATLTPRNKYDCLKVPGLAEKRPSVLIGDSILVRKKDAPEGHWFSGGVHTVTLEEVGLRFSPKFKASPSDRFHVRFKLNRIPLRRQHQALETAFAPGRLLLPLATHILQPAPAFPWTAINPLIDTNARQRQAVDCILRQKPGTVPFVIFGPPGTGKTVTVVEAILQILRTNPNARILACAPSNSAADLIAQRLMELSSDKLFRFYAPSRPKIAVPDNLQPYTFMKSEYYAIPNSDKVKQFKVIVTTCVSAAVFFNIGVQRGHFTHIFIDEAGQANEPEAMIAVKMMADNKTNVVLSGDPKQLGPVIRSAVARDLGLDTSYIERLMRRDIYDEVGGHGRSVVKLTQNFRSHPAILKFPNERFYKGDLQPCADPNSVGVFIGSDHLEAKDFPIVFHAMAGKDDREASSPSFFNIDEVSQVKTTVEELLGDAKLKLTADDIGVIAPYHAQVRRIRKTLKGVAEGIQSGSAEEFQGQERPVIIISTTRSSKDFIEFDLRHTLGFVANPRRFNVAVTRAKALLVIIGDPTVLSLDPLWRSFLNYVYKRGGWRGLPISWDPYADVDETGGYDRAMREAAQAEMDELTRQMEAMASTSVQDEVLDEPWQRHDG
ncbi:P-loop containing nucleoside triphosphate hydrolase protein [Guyanagaster necrorhizus]|uniref:RNA helicase n=1 Tax=Guyanagaster necrorhizus TaxID=856835 RepID=A0A9P8AN08_9AGAR|nr:P-loop containing nucleoside triphosphate hydrolase protein [Guyanagaster necrorhizus MCA 3950]KAG7441319.1 P-loop containing nucleoside triphosphate hydrolase protein [Guyanagaster necrorhizus MCA 3950]